ncbi:MAG: hypothetical protein M2R45_00320 [Verrucomicrobia subdivision 3 bacterium]|nr:hypothetical protein [Limisphaerales bacterium]MCS1412921.1 hypothetical protein [Limisphaerales bacterium]
MNARIIVAAQVIITLTAFSLSGAEDSQPFGPDFPNLDNAATGQWWSVKVESSERPDSRRRTPKNLINLNVPRDEVVAFAVYTHDRGTLKLSAQLFPLLDGEPRRVRLEFQQDGNWRQIATALVVYPGWSTHFRIDGWDNTRDVPYRVRHARDAMFEGLIRRDPIEKEEIVLASLSCNSSRTSGPRPRIVENIQAQDPDLLFFAGDQTYHHTQHTAGWLEFGLQFRELFRTRPMIAIPDDHDVGQGNIWGAEGKKAATPAGPDGGYFYPVDYINMVQRAQTWHLPDPCDASPIQRGITVYFTNLKVGGIDFAILEDRKFKTGPEGTIPKMGPRPDHINDPSYNRATVDLPGLKLLGDRQLRFLQYWSQDWTGASMKAVLSQTAFCGAVHLHGTPNNRLLADLDSNAWPQTGRNKALTEIRRAWSPHLCGDQHLAVVVQHGIETHRDGPFGFTSPAIVNTIYGRWWHPLDEKAGNNPIPGSPLPWTGDYEDGLGNAITMHAYANPEDQTDQLKRSDGYGLIRFNKVDRTIRFECWPRFADLSIGDLAQFPGWPITIKMSDNDGRQATHLLPELQFSGIADPVVQVTREKNSEILYTIRIQGRRFRPPVYAPGSYTINIGQDRPGARKFTGVTARPQNDRSTIPIRF